MSLLLLFRSPQGTPYGSYWGPHFPRKSRGHNSHWNRHFPDQPSLTVPPNEPSAPTTFALLLAQDAAITFSWRTGVFKSYSGKERRSSSVTDPAVWFEGQAHLVGADVRTMRAQLARRAARGLPFLLGLPHEEISVRAHSTGTTVPVYSTESDWCLPGQPVYVVHQTHGTAYGVIQSVAADSITLDVAPGDCGKRAARVIPAVPVYLDPQQTFARYPTQAPQPIETMQIRARLANAGYTSAATTASMALAGTATGVVFYAPTAGAAGNALQIQFVGDAVGIDSVDTSTPGLLVYHFIPGTTTVAQMCTRIERTDFVVVTPFTGRSTSALVIGDEFSATNLTGGGDFAYGTIGTGATITEWNGRPVWDRGINVEGTVPDSIQSMTQVTDLGGLPLSSASATYADWGRVVNASGDLVDDWQWLRKMLDTLRGAWRGFWLTTARADLVPVSTAAGQLTVSAGESDVFAWWPLQRTCLEIVQADGTVTRVVISDAVDNHDGTATLSIEDEIGAAVTLSGSAISSVSWLEVVRLETDQVKVAVAQGRWTTTLQGRAIQDVALDEPSTFAQYEASVESSQPREGIKIQYGTQEHLIATGTRAITINSETYEPSPAGRDGVTMTVDDSAASGTIRIPTSHDFAKRWTLGLVPPQSATVTLYRQQPGGFEVIFRGDVLAMRPEGHVAVFQTISTFNRALSRRLPTLAASRKCPHVLGDDNCRKDIEAMKVTTTVLSVSGRTVTVASIGGNVDGWANGGRFVHVASGEAMTTFQQTGADVMLQRPIAGLAIGDTVDVYPGCGKLVSICRDKFANVPNFGNAPQLPTTNPMRATGFGVISS